MTKSPATSGITDQETPLTTTQGFFFARMITRAEVSVPVMAVGKPSGISRAEAVSRIIAVAAMPDRAILPPAESIGTGISVSIGCFRAPRWVKRSIQYVTAIEKTDGKT